MNARRRPLALVALVAALVALALLVLPDPSEVVVVEQADEQTTQPDTAGVWYCVPPEGDVARSAIVEAAPPGGERPSRFAESSFRGSGETETGELFPGAGAVQVLEDPSTPVEVRWDDQPMVVSQLVTHDEEPAGEDAGPCVPSVATTWYVPGVTTASGATAQLLVANPFSTEAAVAVDFFTAGGLESPVAVQNVPVPAEGTTTIDLTEVAPQREDLGIRVTARSGRVAVRATQSSVPTINGVLGRSWVGADSATSTTWHLPWVGTAGDGTAGFGDDEESDDDETEEPTDPDDIEVVVEGEAEPGSWLWVANPSSDEVAQLNLSLLTSGGRVVPEVVTPLQVNPEAVARIDLEPFLADLDGDVGAQVVVTNDVPVVVGGGVVVSTGSDVERSGIAVLAGQRSPDTNWSLTGPTGSGRRQLLSVANPTEETSTVSISAWTGATSVRPADLQNLVLAPGQAQTVDLEDLELPGSSFTAFVGVTEGQVTASLRSATDSGPLGLAAPAGVPSRIWESSGIATTVRREGGMVNRYGTDLGLEAPDPVDTATPAPGGGFGDEGSVDVTPDPGASPGPTSADPTPTGDPTTDGGSEDGASEDGASEDGGSEDGASEARRRPRPMPSRADPSAPAEFVEAVVVDAEVVRDLVHDRAGDQVPEVLGTGRPCLQRPAEQPDPVGHQRHAPPALRQWGALVQAQQDGVVVGLGRDVLDRDLDVVEAFQDRTRDAGHGAVHEPHEVVERGGAPPDPGPAAAIGWTATVAGVAVIHGPMLGPPVQPSWCRGCGTSRGRPD